MTKTTTETATDNKVSIKGWSHFQHFKDRRPPWIKLYRDLLDDLDWHRLAPEHAKALVMFWLIASEYDGQLPDVARLAFRLRTTETKIIQHLNALKHWLIQDDINAISTRYQDDAPETETEGDKETEGETDPQAGAATVKPTPTAAEVIYSHYPTKVGRKAAIKAITAAIKNGADPQMLNDRTKAYAAAVNLWPVDERQFVPNPATWYNQGRWDDDPATWIRKATNGNGAQRNGSDKLINTWHAKTPDKSMEGAF